MKKTGSHQQLGLTSGCVDDAQDSLPARRRSATVDRMSKKLVARVRLSCSFASRRIIVTDFVRPPLDKEQDEKLRTENAQQHG